MHHWNKSLFTFRTTRSPGLRFENGQFTMIGVEVAGRPLMRAYSIASANYEEHLEFFSIKVQDGPLTSRLQHLKPGDPIFISPKPTGTLLIHDLKQGSNLFLLGTGTGLAPFLSIIKDPETYQRFCKIVLVHGVRQVTELAYQALITDELPSNAFFGEDVRAKLIYYPTVTREPYPNRGRITELFEDQKWFERMGLPPLSVDDSRFMICGGPRILKDACAMLNGRGFEVSPHIGAPGDYVIERAFVEK